MCVINGCRWQKTCQMYTSLSFELATFWLTHMHKSGTIISSSNKIWNETALFNCKSYQSEHTTNICLNLKSCLVHKRNGLPCFQLREKKTSRKVPSSFEAKNIETPEEVLQHNSLLLLLCSIWSLCLHKIKQTRINLQTIQQTQSSQFIPQQSWACWIKTNKGKLCLIKTH
jgi:hypothetical protein